MELRYDKEKMLKSEFKQMWRKIFADSPSYEKFYFDYLYKNNEVLYAKQGETLVGMLHLNPYRVLINGYEQTLHYIVGVATDERYRRQGIMRRLLLEAMNDMAERGEIFTYLMPANKAYYEPFDFSFVQTFCMDTAKSQEGDTIRSNLEILNSTEDTRVALFLERILRKNYKVFTRMDEAYIDQLRAECQSEHGDILVYEKDGKIVGICCYDQDEDCVYVRHIFSQEEDMERQILAYFKGKTVKLRKDGGKKGTSSSIMARILRLDLLFPLMQATKEMKFIYEIKDAYFKQQDGIFEISFALDACKIQKSKDTASRSISISDLTSLVFGFADDSCRKKYPEFQFLKTLSPLMIPEIV